ncbi:hypothetical protein LSH36_301g02079 [Paralvinella palmiformis]|uniref:DNA repair protein RAD51 homolog 3 n=1 Tax=Paralvinella palmiformis TaxID=53620 RepID=A0AAD9JHX0_9ANNE|nr:hypothetical protein LSH36_301g02079 [Paralvinella palmiformis]
MDRLLTSFPFPASLRLKFHNKGFKTVGDVCELKPTELSKELGISKEEALETLNFLQEETRKVKQQCQNVNKPLGQEVSCGSNQGVTSSCQLRTVLDLLQDERSQQYIVTFSEQLDTILGGGVPLTKITEICGAPGVGKTQLSIQLAVDVQIPDCFGGVEGQAIFIDTEGSFIIERVVDIAEATVKHCQRIARIEQNQVFYGIMRMVTLLLRLNEVKSRVLFPADQLERLNTFNVESILDGIHYFRCHDYVELLALVQILPDFIVEHSQVSLVVLDSIAFPFRHHFEDFSLRTRLLNGLAQSFIKLAVDFKLAVLLTNQMTTKINADHSQPSHLIPALGESWGHTCTIRIILYWQQNTRHALLYKSPYHKETTVPFQITTGGIRDICLQEKNSHSEVISSPEVEQCRKRQKTETVT